MPVNLILAFAFDIFELPEISADLLDFLGLQLVGHVELFWGFWVLALIWLEELAATEPPLPPSPAYNSARCLHGTGAAVM